MYFVYGTYQHPDHEVNLVKMEIQPIFSPRGDRFASWYKLHIIGEIQLTPTEDASARDPNPQTEAINRHTLFNTKIKALIDAYADNYQSCGLIHDNGTQTKHYLSNAATNNISGNRVLYRSWNRGVGDEYATVRTFYIVLGALFDESDSGIYAYREEVELHGTGAGTWEWVNNQTGIPQQQPKFPFVHQTIRQYGSIVGVNTWALGNVPPPLYPQWEHQDRRVQKYEFPTWHGNQYRLYGYQWSYYMEAPTGQVAVPNLY